MQARSVSRLFWGILPVLLSSLACRAATRMIIPDTPTPLPPTATVIVPTASPTVPPATATPVFQAACPSLLSDVLDTATEDDSDSEATVTKRTLRQEDDLYYMVTYSLKEDQLGQRDEIYIPDHFEDGLDRRAMHEQIWDYFAAIIPSEERSFVTEFSAMSDGRSHILGAVSRTMDDPTKWGLRVDVMDANDNYSLTYTLMHEFGHLVTLKSSQVAVDKLVIFNPENDKFYERALDNCSQYFAHDGCSTPKSYINEFFSRYWQEFYPEWQEIDQMKEDGPYYSSLHNFYKAHADQFLTQYAATSPEEDIAESWAFFIFSPKPENDSISNEKILFFYEYPELVQMRQQILTHLCEEFPQ